MHYALLFMRDVELAAFSDTSAQDSQASGGPLPWKQIGHREDLQLSKLMQPVAQILVCLHTLPALARPL